MFYLLHGLGLGSRSYTGYRQTDVDGGTDTLVEELSLQEDLTVSNGNHVGGNVGRYVTSLGLDDGQGGQGTTTHLVRPAEYMIMSVSGVASYNKCYLMDITQQQMWLIAQNSIQLHISIQCTADLYVSS